MGYFALLDLMEIFQLLLQFALDVSICCCFACCGLLREKGAAKWELNLKVENGFGEAIVSTQFSINCFCFIFSADFGSVTNFYIKFKQFELSGCCFLTKKENISSFCLFCLSSINILEVIFLFSNVIPLVTFCFALCMFIFISIKRAES